MKCRWRELKDRSFCGIDSLNVEHLKAEQNNLNISLMYPLITLRRTNAPSVVDEDCNASN